MNKMKYVPQPDTIVEASDRQYIVDKAGSLRVFHYYTREEIIARDAKVAAEQAKMRAEVDEAIAALAKRQRELVMTGEQINAPSPE